MADLAFSSFAKDVFSGIVNPGGSVPNLLGPFRTYPILVDSLLWMFGAITGPLATLAILIPNITVAQIGVNNDIAGNAPSLPPLPGGGGNFTFQGSTKIEPDGINQPVVLRTGILRTRVGLTFVGALTNPFDLGISGVSFSIFVTPLQTGF